jgi:peptidoglycan/xylan/chitin deacetylase (PgdA/CDA1 family)
LVNKLVILLLLLTFEASQAQNFSISQGAIVRGDSTKREIALVFTADEFGEGLPAIIKTLRKHRIKASFFFTGRFYRNPSFQSQLLRLKVNGHYLGPHSNDHLLYCDWNKRDSLLVTKDSFVIDLAKNLVAIRSLGADVAKIRYYIPPYEWWNDTIAAWSREAGLQLVSFTPGIRTNADYTYPEMQSYKSSDWIIQSLKHSDSLRADGLNGSIILIHAGTDPRRKDKLYNKLNEIIQYLAARGYRFKRIDELIGASRK